MNENAYSILRQDRRMKGFIYEVFVDNMAGLDEFTLEKGEFILPGSTAHIANLRQVFRLRHDGNWEKYRDYADIKLGTEINTLLFQKSGDYWSCEDSTITFYKITDEQIDIKSITNIVALVDGKAHEYSKEDIQTASNPNRSGVDLAMIAGYPLVAITSDDFSLGAGTWFAYAGEENYTESVEYETVHLLDLKYLPENILKFLALAEASANDGGIGHTEIKQVEILPPTVCQLVRPEGYEVYYDIPNSYNLDGDHEYFLYVDGKEFKYDYNPRLGSGWGDTDSTDRRFHSYNENIGPNIIDPIPETVTASIKQVSKIIHPIEDKYLQNLPARVGLLEKDGVLLEKAEYSFEETSDGSILVLGNVPEAALLKAGMTLTVHFDGINYVCPLTKENEILIAGNSYYVDPFYHEDTGEPFAIVAGSLLGGIALFAIDGQGAHTVGITVGDNSIDPARLPKGCVGYTEPKVITFNGDLTGKTLVDNAFVKLSDEPIDLNEVTRVVADLHPIVAENMGTSRMEFTAETWTIDSTGNGQVLVNPEIGNCLISVTVAEEDYSVGVWGLCETGSDEGGNLIAYAWVSEIEYGEIVHKIDQKYLPGVCLPVVELTFVSTDEVTELNAEGAAMMDALNGGPCVMKILDLNSDISITVIPGIFTQVNSPTYVASIAGIEFSVSKNDGVWKIIASPTS